MLEKKRLIRIDGVPWRPFAAVGTAMGAFSGLVALFFEENVRERGWSFLTLLVPCVSVAIMGLLVALVTAVAYSMANRFKAGWAWLWGVLTTIALLAGMFALAYFAPSAKPYLYPAWMGFAFMLLGAAVGALLFVLPATFVNYVAEAAGGLVFKTTELEPQGWEKDLEEPSEVPERVEVEERDGVLFSTANATLVRYPVHPQSCYEVPDNITRIAAGAFKDCKDLTRVIIHGGVNEIDAGAFKNCERLEEVDFEGYSRDLIIADFAFAWCQSLTNVDVKRVKSIGSGTFLACARLKNFSGSSLLYASDAGVLFDNKLETLVAYPPGRTDTDVVVRNGTLRIGDDAFLLYGLGNAAESAPNVKVDDLDINSLPADCNISVKLPEGLTAIGTRAFAYSWISSISLPNSLESIAEKAFDECKRLKEIHIPRCTTHIGLDAFASAGLERISVDESNSFFKAVDGVLYDKSGKTLLVFPAARTGVFVVPDGVTTIEADAFIGTSLNGLVVPQSVNTLRVSRPFVSLETGILRIIAGLEAGSIVVPEVLLKQLADVYQDRSGYYVETTVANGIARIATQKAQE